MKFLADANIAPRTIKALRQADFNVKSIIEEGQGEISDEKVIKLATKESRIILTHDKDFGNILIYPVLKHKGVILIRLRNQRPQNVIRRLVPFLEAISLKKIKNNLIILTEKGIRAYKE